MLYRKQPGVSFSRFGDQLQEVRPPASALPISLDLDAQHVRVGALPEQIHPPVLEPRIRLHVVDAGAGDFGAEEVPHQGHRPVRGMLHGLHGVGAGQGVVRRVCH